LIIVIAFFNSVGIPALAQFCQVAALILLFDSVFMFTIFLAVLTLKMELKRVRENDPDLSAVSVSKASDFVRHGKRDDFSKSSSIAKAKIILVRLHPIDKFCVYCNRLQDQFWSML
jgi:hypothetical protein